MEVRALPWEGSVAQPEVLIALAVLLAIGIAAGIVDATTGGGGMIQIPALFALAGPNAMAVAPIMALNKVSAATGNVVSFWRFRASPEVSSPERNTLLVALVTGLPGVVAGVWLATKLDTEQFTPLLLAALAVVLLYVLFIQPRITIPQRTVAPGGRTLMLLGAVALGLGFYDGLLGPATGSILILVMQWVLGSGLRAGLATAKSVQLLFNLIGAVAYTVAALPSLAAVIALAGGNAIGGALGSTLVMRMSDRLLRLLVGCGVAGAMVMTLVT